MSDSLGDVSVLLSNPAINDALMKLASDEVLLTKITEMIYSDDELTTLVMNPQGELDPLEIVRHEKTLNLLLDLIKSSEYSTSPTSADSSSSASSTSTSITLSDNNQPTDFSEVNFDKSFLARPMHDPPRRRRVRLNGFDVGDAIIRTAIANKEIQASLEGGSSSSAPTSNADGRRIYVGSIDYRFSEEDIAQLFRLHGNVTRVDMPRDARTGMSKGYCFVEMGTQDECRVALVAMEGFMLEGRPLKIRPPKGTSSEFLATLPSRENAPMMPREEINPACRVFVRSLPADITEVAFRTIFEACGPIKNVVLVPNHATGGHKGYGFIVYEDPAAAQLAITTLNGFALGNKQLSVSQAKSNTDSTQGQGQGQGMGQGQGSSSLMHGQLGVFGQHSGQHQGQGYGQPPMGMGMGMGDMSMPPMGQIQGQQMMSYPPSSSSDSKPHILYMTNMFTYDDIYGMSPDQLKEEVGSECSKYGRVVEVLIQHPSDLPNLQGEESQMIDVFVTFAFPDEASVAFTTMNGRPFAGRSIVAKLLTSIPPPPPNSQYF